MRLTFFIVIFLTLFSCRINRQISKSIKNHKFTKINAQDSIFYAKYETSNIQYKSFLNAQENNSIASNELLRVHSEAWVNEYTYSYQEPMQRNYFRLAKFDHNPVVNINFKAAKQYCDWLTKIHNKENVYFRLPTKSEYLRLLETVNIKYDSDNPDDYSEFNFNMKFEKNYPIDGTLYTAEPDYYKNQNLADVPQASYTQNKYGMKNIVGNVAELLQDGSYIGGSWDSFPSEVLVNSKFDRPLPTLGFRVVKVKKAEKK